MKKRTLTVLLTAALTMSLFAGCGNGDRESGSQSDGGTQSQESAGEGEADSGDEAPEESGENPADDLSQHREITAWLYADDYKYFGSKDEAPLVKYLNEKFNCNVTFQQPPVGSETDSFNLMLGVNAVIIAIAGMEGALASVLGGLADCPVIAVPTSVGYGASFGGLSALLSMLNSCASGVSVVNIDNGFGAGYLANQINHMTGKEHHS